VTVVFAPQAQGTLSGTLHVTTSAAAAPMDVTLGGQGEAAPDLSSGGCSVALGDTLLDPTLWALAALALVALLYRHHARSAQRRAERSGRRLP
jgi:hypothetical protein